MIRKSMVLDDFQIMVGAVALKAFLETICTLDREIYIIVRKHDVHRDLHQLLSPAESAIP